MLTFAASGFGASSRSRCLRRSAAHEPPVQTLDHCLPEVICYAPRVMRMMFLALLCALIIPRVAWGAHMSGHDQSLPASVSHVHHDDHTHIAADSDEKGSQEDGKMERHGGLAHNHLPADVLSMMGDGNADTYNTGWFYGGSSYSLDRRSERPPAQAPKSLLRPPRTA